MAQAEWIGEQGEQVTQRDALALQDLREDIRERLERYCREQQKPAIVVFEFLLAFIWGWYRKSKTLDLRLAPSALPAVTEEVMNRAGANWRACEEAERRRQQPAPLVAP
jgi:hypothetical protein